MPPKGGKKGKGGSKKKATKSKDLPPALPQLTPPTLDPAPFSSHLKKISIRIGGIDDGACVHYTTDSTNPTIELEKNRGQQLYKRKPIFWKEGLLTLKLVVAKEGFEPCFIEVEYFVEVDPWKRYPSPFGGRMSQNDEWIRLSSSECPEPLLVRPPGEDGAAILGTEEIFARKMEVAKHAEEMRQAMEAARAREEAAQRAKEDVGQPEAARAEDDAGEIDSADDSVTTKAGKEGAAAGAGAAAAKALLANAAVVYTTEEDGVTTSTADGTASQIPAELAQTLPESLSLAGAELCLLVIDRSVWAELTALDLSANRLTSSAVLQTFSAFGGGASTAGTVVGASTAAIAAANAATRTAVTPAAQTTITQAHWAAQTTCWLRKLILAGNCLDNMVTLSPLLARTPCLLHLDLSQNPTVGESVGTVDFSTVPLRALILQHVGLTSVDLKLPTGIGCLSALNTLDLSYNKLADLQELDPMVGKGDLSKKSGQGKGCFEHLAHLSLQHNPFTATDGGSSYEAWQKGLTKLIPSLKSVDDEEAQAHTFGWGAVDMIQETVQRSTAKTLAEQDSASCSCVEGNPCAVPKNCRDWPNRFDVARAAREEKYDMVF
jgi:hypothetical protein